MKRSGKKNEGDGSFRIRKDLVIGLFVILSLAALFFMFNNKNEVAAVGQASVCCERTTAGAWCQNSPPATCNTNGYNQAPTSCESTNYCKLGTCVDSQQGTCLPNVPQRVCQNDGGVWMEGKPEDIPQCKLGCCLIGDQAAYVTQTRCKSLAGEFGANSTFRSDIKDEVTCIASANPQVRGACVINDGPTRNCRLLTRGECQQLQSGTDANTTIEFHEGLLCSAESLATNCGPTKSTTCVPGKDQVYFMDSCGNIANVYDASKINDKSYWTDIQDPASSCNFGSSNANSATCGNCDYLSGSLCKAYQRGNSQTPVPPTYGSFVCADLSCNYNGKTYKQGESWCGNTQGADKNLPGSEYSVLRCFNGEVTSELCDAFRDKICSQNSISTDEGNFSSANCIVNRWQDCTSIDNKQDCENIDKRDCKWISLSSQTDLQGNPVKLDSEGKLVNGTGASASCVPKYAPGFSFWNSTEDVTGGDAEAICAQANQNCVVKFTRGLLGGLFGGDWSCDKNCECVGLKKGDSFKGLSDVSQWVNQRMNMCVSIGDCGNSTNYIGIKGYQNKDVVAVSRIKP